MANFTVRVELHKASYPNEYEPLHKAMKEAGFSRQVSKDGKTWYKLPTAEYSKIGNYTSTQILDSAKAATSSIWKNYSVLVTKSEEIREWYNLEESKYLKLYETQWENLKWELVT